MKKYIFIYGKNPDISLAEIISYFEARGIGFNIIDFSNSFLVVEIDNIMNKMMENLGGTIKIAQIFFSSDEKDIRKIKEDMERKTDFDSLFKKLPNKTMFGLSSYNSKEEYIFFSEFLKQKMKEYGISAGYFHISGKRHVLTHVEVIKKRMIDKHMEFILCRGKSFYIGKTIAVHNPFEFQKRDIGRPVQRVIYSIPPRLSKIMINMSKATEGVLLDSFCGIGGILQEALLMGIDIRGVDNDKKCINGCIENMKWLEREYGIDLENIEDKIRVGDSRNLSSYFDKDFFDAIVSEPYLGPPLKKKPNNKKAKEILNDLEPLFRLTIREMTSVLKPGGRIVIISPFFFIGGKKLTLDMEAIAKQNGCEIINPLKKYRITHRFPLVDFEKRHKTLRQINIIEKPGN